MTAGAAANGPDGPTGQNGPPGPTGPNGPNATARGAADYNGERVLVVGGYGSLGAAVSEALVAQGAKVAIAGRSIDRAKELAARLPGPGIAAAHAVDVSDRADVGRLVDAVVQDWGGVDVLINCASVLVTESAQEISEESWRQITDINLLGAFWLSQSVGNAMIAAGRGGRILHLSSVRGLLGARRGFTAYGASKAGLDLLVKQLAAEWGQYQVTVNAVAPGFVRTEFVEMAASDPAFMRRVVSRIPLGRTAEVHEVADAVVFMASPRASFITGQVLYVDGGVTTSQ